MSIYIEETQKPWQRDLAAEIKQHYSYEKIESAFYEHGLIAKLVMGDPQRSPAWYYRYHFENDSRLHGPYRSAHACIEDAFVSEGLWDKDAANHSLDAAIAWHMKQEPTFEELDLEYADLEEEHARCHKL